MIDVFLRKGEKGEKALTLIENNKIYAFLYLKTSRCFEKARL